MRLIDADKAEKAIKEEANAEYCQENYSVCNGLKIAQQLVKDAETVDAVEVVRCKDCIYYDENIQYTEDGVRYCDCINHNRWEKEDWFCGDGERKNDAGGID